MELPKLPACGLMVKRLLSREHLLVLALLAGFALAEAGAR
ncbi:MAG: hypothetical protein CM15mP80_07240 [Alphaproteobacteria bacterium]|nr:MAG: hypothetical protein CM15mP80_07240 [Alphaproteobacteria bacterium]